MAPRQLIPRVGLTALAVAAKARRTALGRFRAGWPRRGGVGALLLALASAPWAFGQSTNPGAGPGSGPGSETPQTLPAGRIFGKVLDAGSGDPLPGAAIRLAELGQSRIANEIGWFQFEEVPPGPHTVVVEMLGFATRTDSLFVLEGQLLALTVRLAVEPIALEGITVTARPSWLAGTGFLRRQERMNAYSGRQWTRDQIEALNPVLLQDVVTRTQGVRRALSPSGQKVYLGRRGRTLAVFIDDVYMPDYDLDKIPPSWVEAIEIYQGGSGFMPPEYAPHFGSGVILIWLKRDGRE